MQVIHLCTRKLRICTNYYEYAPITTNMLIIFSEMQVNGSRSQRPGLSERESEPVGPAITAEYTVYLYTLHGTNNGEADYTGV